ncbi:MAG: hypothetical protein CMH16_24510 [Methylobacterium sp.]|nr:hypothetical protein [Methylobacterium sp.]
MRLDHRPTAVAVWLEHWHKFGSILMREAPMRALHRAALVIVASGVSNAYADEIRPRLFQNPPVLHAVNPGPTLGLRALRPTTAPGAIQADVTYDLNVEMTKNATIDNPSTGGVDRVELRSYNGALVGPTIEAIPSQTARIRLHNNLPKETEVDCPPPNGRSHILPSCFSITNLHFHGLHVSPAGNSDNVLLEVAPDQNFEYEVNIPSDHPAGTFWYHAHRHGSTALQVSSGMVGALIVRGHRTVTQRDENGFADIDTVLRASTGTPLAEQIMVFQQIAYACFEPNSAVPKTSPVTLPAGKSGTVWSCPDQGDAGVGRVQYYSTQFGPPSWPASGHYTSITGQIQPRFGQWDGKGTPIHAGDIQRWRMIHGGVRDTIGVQIVKAIGVDPSVAASAIGPDPKLGAAGQGNWVDEHCRGAGTQVLPQWEFALDGLTRSKAAVKEVEVLQPGYRSDTLVAFPTEGIYCILDQAIPANGLINPRPEGKDRRLLGLVRVQGGTPVQGALETYIQTSLAAANKSHGPQVEQQLATGDLSAFTPIAKLPEQSVQTRQVAFNIVLPPGRQTGVPPRFEINDAIYNPDRVDFTARLGTVEDWDVTSKTFPHIFHIHVNPFEIIDIKDPNGQSIFGKDSCTEPENDNQYCDLKGVTRDTLFIKQGYHALLRTAYIRYIGEYVMHCHILDHEDQGMMLNVAVVPEGTNPADAGKLGTSGAAHRH